MAGRRALFQQLHADSRDAPRVAKINPHPVSGRDLACQIPRSDSVRRRVILRFPRQRVVVAVVPEMQETPHRHQKFQRRLKLLPDGHRQQIHFFRPIALQLHRRNQREPVRHVVVAQPARRILQIGLQMEHRVAELSRGAPACISASFCTSGLACFTTRFGRACRATSRKVLDPPPETCNPAAKS